MNLVIHLIFVAIPFVTCSPEIPIEAYAHPLELDYLPVVESARQFAPQHTYGAPQADYGPPQYGPPASPQKLITKNVYIHVPPPNDDDQYTHTQILEPQIPKKHYKIIFIKAPTAPTPTVPVIPETIPDEHKTLVYVLVKKPEPQPQIEIPKVRPTEPSKPEVYFIKYKDPKVSQAYGPP